MAISPLEQLYIDTTSKEDMLAEIHDLRRMLADARGEWSKSEREVARLNFQVKAIFELKAELNLVSKQLAGQRTLVSRYKKRLGLTEKNKNTEEILTHMEKGLSDAEILSLGYPKTTVWRYRKMFIDATTL